nr:glycosyltransferase [Oculatella sp. LEGE 06141]
MPLLHMKTIQAVHRYFPGSCGGIQTHLSEVMPELQARGVDCHVAASQAQSTDDHYLYNGVAVYRYPVFPPPRPEPNHGATPHGGFPIFANWLKGHRADLYHQHQWTPQCGLPHLRLAKELGLATVISLHLPQPICLRQTLMLNGTEQCDGRIDTVRCSYCNGVSHRLPPPVVQGLSHLPRPISLAAKGIHRRLETVAAIAPLTDGILRPAFIPAWVAARRHGLLEMAQFADRILVMSQWFYDAMVINGIPETKLALLRQGISVRPKLPRPSPPNRPLRVGFLGRWDMNKGIHILVEAIKQLPTETPIELVIHGVEQDEIYKKQVIDRIGDDPRIQVAPQLAREEIPLAFSQLDVLAVPSQWLETGPLVVLEAHAHDIPVVGSDLGGIPERVRHEVDGLLVPASNIKAWADALALLAHHPNTLARLRRGIRPVRTVATEAAELKALYQTILASSGPPRQEVYQ